MKIATLILAAGKSSRMGATKQLLKINDTSLLQNIIEKSLRIPNTSTFCVLGANAEKIKAQTNFNNVHTIINKDYNLGLSTSIITGINYINSKETLFDGVLLVLADQPAITIEYYKEMLLLFFANNTEKIIASKYNDNWGIPVLFPKSDIPKLTQMHGDQGAKTFLNQHKARIIVPTVNAELLDIDTPIDYNNYINSIL